MAAMTTDLQKEYDALSVCSESDDEQATTGIDLGFLQPPENDWLLHPVFFPSKVGGKPAWLDPELVLNSKDLECCVCNKTMIFLLQLYAPDDSKNHTFHRTIFVFCCKDPSCYQQIDNCPIKVFRCCLPRDNKYYSSSPPDYDDSQAATQFPSYTPLCYACGCAGALRCAACQIATYCSKQHQKMDWKYHKVACKSKNVSNEQILVHTKKAFLFPESELVIEPEELDEVVDNKTEKGSSKSFTNDDLKNVDEKEFEKFCEDIDDEVFLKFQTRIKHNPDQVIRYNRGGEPLLCTDSAIPKNIPNCSCGVQKTFEFQIMPQLLTYLDVDSSIEGPTIDWGTLLVYTCRDDCKVEGYSQEFVWKQNFASKESK